MKLTLSTGTDRSARRAALARRLAALPPAYPLAASLLLALAPMPATAVSVSGSLANFDTVNDTGKPAYGFEIEIEGSNFFKGSVGSVFGLNRSFGGVAGGNPLGVVRFGSASVSDYNDALGKHAGVHITYGGTIGAISTLANDPLHPDTTPDESCWPGVGGANANWPAKPCNHCGITTPGSPAKTICSRLVQNTARPTLLENHLAGIPAVRYLYTPARPSARRTARTSLGQGANPGNRAQPRSARKHRAVGARPSGSRPTPPRSTRTSTWATCCAATRRPKRPLAMLSARRSPASTPCGRYRRRRPGR